VLLSLLFLSPGHAQGAAHPLEPPDTRSPRGTIATLTRSIDEAWELFVKKDPAFREPFRAAARCLDVSGFPAEVAPEMGAEHALLLKEILDRIELPPAAEIPGEVEARERDLRSWTIPHTEVTLAKAAEGDRQGEFLFSAATVKRAPEFFARVRHLPYQPGKQGGHYDDIRSGVLSPVMGTLAPRLPAWARREIGNQFVWQWAATLLALALSIATAFLALRLGRSWARREVQARGHDLFAPFLFPLTVIALSRFMQEVLFRFLRLSGATYFYGRLALTAIAAFAIAWLIGVTLTRAGEVFIRHSRAGERPLNAQLLRLSLRLVTILVVTGFLFVAAESLGLPVAALLAGLGVGGLAVALATQGTLENLIGGLILYADQPVRVGDFFRFGERIGVVEEIGIRSVRIRTVDRTVVAVPNAELVRMQLENFSRRDRFRLRGVLRLPIETTPDQMRHLLSRLWEMLQEHPQLVRDTGWARLVEFGQGSLDVELVALAETTDLKEFLAIRQDVFLRAMSLVEEAGTRLVVPLHVQLGARDTTVVEERSRAAAKARE
jgi:MscS family membrane protein